MVKIPRITHDKYKTVPIYFSILFFYFQENQIELFCHHFRGHNTYTGHLRISRLKFIYSEKATTFCEISTLLLCYIVPVKSKVEISQNFVAFSKDMDFTSKLVLFWK